MHPDHRAIYIGLHGWWGSGKSWLAQTLPGPRLVLDTESGALDVADRTDRKVEVRLWDPLTEPVPDGLTSHDSVIVNIRDLHKVGAIMMLLKSGKHPFNSVILDSFTELQAMIKTVVANPGHEYDPNAVFDHQSWGRLKNHGGLLLRDLRDLTWPDAAKRVNVAVVMGSDTEILPAVPLLEGGVRKQLAGWFDILGYLFTAMHHETKEEVRVLQIAKTPDAEAKCRLHKVKVTYGTHIDNPDLEEVINILNGELK